MLLAPLTLLGLTACGVAFSSTFEGTEMFKGISLSGDRTPGAKLTVTLTLAPVYPVPIEVACFYEDDDTLTKDQQKLAFHDRAVPAGGVTVEAAAPDVKPGDDVERIEVSFSFTAPLLPGDYFIACLTPAAPENGLGVSFDIFPAN